MEHRYSQLSLDERIELARLQAEGSSIRQIAASLDRAPSTISRELKRNKTATKAYKPALAEERAAARRWKGSRMERQAALVFDVCRATYFCDPHAPCCTSNVNPPRGVR